MTNPMPRWAVLKVHGEAPTETDRAEWPGVELDTITVADRVFGPYATQRAATMVARGLNRGVVGEAFRFIPVGVTPIDGWTWDGIHGCCSTCKGTGYSGDEATPDGRCWDCRGTGHAHAGPCVEPSPEPGVEVPVQGGPRD